MAQLRKRITSHGLSPSPSPEGVWDLYTLPRGTIFHSIHSYFCQFIAANLIFFRFLLLFGIAILLCKAKKYQLCTFQVRSYCFWIFGRHVQMTYVYSTSVLITDRRLRRWPGKYMHRTSWRVEYFNVVVQRQAAVAVSLKSKQLLFSCAGQNDSRNISATFSPRNDIGCCSVLGLIELSDIWRCHCWLNLQLQLNEKKKFFKCFQTIVVFLNLYFVLLHGYVLKPAISSFDKFQ